MLTTCCLALAADADPSVDSAGDALSRWGRYPWYDAGADDVRRVDVSPPREWNWPDWNIHLPGSLLEWAAWTLVAALLALVVYLLVRAYLRWAAGGAAGKDKAPAADQADSGRIEALPLPAQSGRLDLLSEARRHYQQGNYGRAIICLFSFQLLQLDKRQIIRLAKGKTNRQYLREIGPRAALAVLVEQTMVAFEDVFFGNHPLDRAGFESCWSRLGEFEALAGQAG